MQSPNSQSSNDKPSSGVPQAVIAQAEAIATSNASDDGRSSAPRFIRNAPSTSHAGSSFISTVPKPEPISKDHHETPIEHWPPPIFSTKYGQVDLDQDGFETNAKVANDGRLDININQKSRRFSDLLVPPLRSQLNLGQVKEPATQAQGYIPPSLGGLPGQEPPPPLNVVIHVVGSRGDVQPFIALGKVLRETYHHRVRLATHITFRAFVEENGLEFFDISGDPAELMAFMVKNPGLMADMDTFKSGDVGKRRKGIYEIVQGCWRSCIEIGDGTGVAASDKNLDSRSSLDSRVGMDNHSARPFVADAIIANPPSFAHVHCAEKLGIPLHLMFTMPWSPTQAFPHPLANIQSSNAEPSITNFVSYALVEMMTWQGLGDIINRFREKSLGLEPVSLMWALGMAARLHIPYTYCWSPALIPKPTDWGSHISISGFYFLSLAGSFAPEPDLEAFLGAGTPPIYIGFGSIVVDDPNGMTKLIFEAVKKTGQRALVSKGWGGFGADALGIPEGVFMLGNVPHDWLFQHVSCVVHHGGAGTTAAGVALGKPTVIVPFFGDQPFWGAMVAKAGAGPKPIPSKQLTADNLAASILEALKPTTLARAQNLGAQISTERGTDIGAKSFHDNLNLNSLRCALAPSRAAVWRVEQTNLVLSAFAATTLGNEGLLDFSDLKLYRPREYDPDDGPFDPISGGASALVGTIGSLMMGFADFPVEILRALKIKPAEPPKKAAGRAGKGEVPKFTSSSQTSVDLTKQVSEPEAMPPGVKPHTEAWRSSSDYICPTGEEPLPPTSSKENYCSVSRSPSRDSRKPNLRKESTNSHCRRRSSGQVSLGAALEARKSIGHIVGAGVKSPMDFTLGIARGFHNAPKLYGDESVRQPDRITGIQSGLKAAGKEFGYGFFDGITGLVTQPLEGAKKEGFAGLVKGFGKGVGGIVLKPGAAIWGLPGYTFKGIYKEMQKHLGASVQNYIVAARTAQGYEEWSNSSRDERLDVIRRWQAAQVKLGKQKQRNRQNVFRTASRSAKSGQMKNYDEQELPADVTMHRSAPEVENASIGPRGGESIGSHKHAVALPNMLNDVPDSGEAVHVPSAATSRRDSLENEIFERAIRASVRESQPASRQGDNEEVENDLHLKDAIQRSLGKSRSSSQQRSLNQTSFDDSGVTIDDNDSAHTAMPNFETKTSSADSNDAELQKAVELSKREYAAHAGDLANSKAEEEIVLKYMQKQSALEEVHRRNMMSSANLTHDHVLDDEARQRAV